ncbi:MAG: hypothetical protein LR001_03635 [Clostridiales bacterium]|nr:hypothetical protein [Clostridiales bacterium]
MIRQERKMSKTGIYHVLESKKKIKPLKELKKLDGITIRQIVRVTGAAKYRVEKFSRDKSLSPCLALVLYCPFVLYKTSYLVLRLLHKSYKNDNLYLKE